MGSKRFSNDYVLGHLIGEIIWLRKLHTHTETDVIYKRCTPEERAEHDRLNKIWFDDTMKNRGKENKITPEWLEYRTYTHDLIPKYLPQSIKFRDYCYFMPENKKTFFKGIQTFLWNTDNCSYDFKEEDIVFTYGKGEHWGDIEITFTLESMPNYQEQTIS